MKRASLTLILCVAGCDQAPDNPGPPVRQGRYAGIGTYPVNELWSRMEVASAPKDKVAATIEDDSQIIVTVDSVTGEVRQCGDLSGYCTTMSPWAGSPAGRGNAPVRMKAHSADVARERQEVASAPAPGR